MSGLRGSLVLVVPLVSALAAHAEFTAYNDFQPNYVTPATNTTTWGATNADSGIAQPLKDWATGTIVAPTMTITRYNLSNGGSGPGAEISGGDAYTIFRGTAPKVAGQGSVMAPSSGWYFNMEFSGLDVNKTYNVATFTDRGNSSYDNKRWANISLVNADSTTSTYACSVGVGNYQVSSTSVSQDSGYNTVEGFVAMWTGITPGPDGKFNINFRAATSSEVPEPYRAGMSAGSGYGPAGLMLQEAAPANAINILPAQINSVVGAATVSGSVSIPAGSNAGAAVNVTLTSSNPAVADLVGATGGVLVLTFPQGGATEQSIQIDIGQAGSTTITSTNDAGLLDDSQPVTVQTGAVTLAPTSLTAPSGAIRPVAVSISAGANDTRAVQVTLTSSNSAVADLVGATGGVLVLDFPQSGVAQQTVNIQLGVVDLATITVTNDGGLTNPSLPVTVQTGAVTVNPASIAALPGSIRQVAVSISAGANDTRSIQVTLTSNNTAVADVVGAIGGVLELTFSQGAGTQQTVNVQLGAVVGQTTTIDVTNDGGLTSPSSVSVAVVNLRSWVVRIHELQGGIGGPDPKITWQKVLTGGYDDGDPSGNFPCDGSYYWRLWDPGLVWQRVYWWFDMADIPSQPRLYTIEAWVPYLGEGDPKSWKQIDCMINGINTPNGWNAAMVPWSQPARTEWIARMPLPSNVFESGWMQAGPGPHCPDGPTCDAGASGPYYWLKKGSELYMDGSTVVGFKYGVSALRITEVFSAAQVCDPPVSEGPVDLRCVGNSDPLYTIGVYGEGFGKGYEANIDGNTLAVENYRWPCNESGQYSSDVLPLSPGLPYDSTHPEYATYSPQLPTGAMSFKLRYDGFNSLKWRTDATGSFSKYNVFTLNEVPDRDFVSGRFGRLYVLATKGGGSTGKMRVEKVYSDESSEITETNLYDWFNQDGDTDSMAVGIDGRLRSLGVDVVGFERLNNDGLAPGGWGGGGNGGDHNGAFLFVHPIPINKSKALTQVKLSIGDQELFGGELCVLGVTLEVGCNSPVFDVAGAGPAGNDPDGSVDQQDFSTFQICVTGENDPGGVFDRFRCACLDIDGDQDIDGQDFLAFEGCASGPAVPAVPGCDARP